MVNKSRMHANKNKKLSGYFFFMNLNIGRDFQICISVPLNSIKHKFLGNMVFYDKKIERDK